MTCRGHYSKIDALKASDTVIADRVDSRSAVEAEMALLTAQPAVRRPDRPAGVRRLVARARSTPGRLTSLMVGLLALGLAAGVVGLVGSVTRSSLIQGVRTTSGPLTVQAQELYRALSDADATAASA